MKEQVIEEGEWKNLIILDACRFDFFKDCYNDYLDGKLERRHSNASATREWLNHHFTQYNEDVVYVSGNPQINSITNVGRFNPKEHFFEIIDVWDFGWDNEIGTTMPKKVTESTIKTRDRFPDKKLIIHFLQPHMPYITMPQIELSSNERRQQNLKGTNYPRKKSESRLLKLKGRIGSFLEIFMKRSTIWKVEEIFGLEPKNSRTKLFKWHRKHHQKIENAYEKNLRYALDAVETLVEHLDEKTVVTADHGEAFGEKGYYEHPPSTHIPILEEVPWLKIEK